MDKGPSEHIRGSAGAIEARLGRVSRETPQQILHVACAARRDYVPHSAAMLHSLLTHSDGHGVHVHYLHGPDLPPAYTRRLAEMVERNGGDISFLGMDDREVGNLRTSELFPPSHWYRVFLPELLPELDRILYLDVDIIVLESLLPLWQTELGDQLLGAVTNVFQEDHLSHLDRLGVAGPEVYFNTGVMLMHLAEMRRSGSTRAVLDWAGANHDKLRLPEQDALNVVLGARRLPLHPRWNCMNSILQFPWAADLLGADAVEEARRRPAIRHFEGPSVNKPWHYLCERGMRELYVSHRRQTPWPRVKAEGVTPRNVVRRLVRATRERDDALSA